MYSPSIIQSKLITAQGILDKLPKNQSFSLHPYTLKQSQDFSWMIEQKWTWDDKEKGIGHYHNLSKAEQIFIQNEKIISANNFLYWARRYAKVKHWSGHKLVSFTPYFAQKVMVNIWGEMEERG